MCGRYIENLDEEALLEALKRDLGQIDGMPEDLTLRAPYNVAPSDWVPAVVTKGEGPAAEVKVPQVRALRWGLVPRWAKDERAGYRMINARSESVAEKPAYRESFQHQRCLVPATGYYEWQRSGRTKRPFHIHPRDGELLLMAGVWTERPVFKVPLVRPGVAADDPRARRLETFSVLTRPASADVASIHDRMPVLLRGAGARAWLDVGATAAELQEVLRRAGQPLVAHAISSLVNRPENDGPELLTPASWQAHDGTQHPTDAQLSLLFAGEDGAEHRKGK